MSNLDFTSNISDRAPKQIDPIEALLGLGLISDPATSKRGRRRHENKGKEEKGGVPVTNYPLKSKQGHRVTHPNLANVCSSGQIRIRTRVRHYDIC